MSTEDKELDNILNAFSVEANHDDETLRRYLSAYPQYAEALLDLLHEIRYTESLAFVETEPAVDARADEAWSQFVGIDPVQEVASAAKSFGDKLRGQAIVALAKALLVPRSVVVALRDRLIVPSSIPAPFIARLADAAESDKKSVLEYLAGPPQLALGAQYKSEDKPEQQGQVTFSKLIESTEMREEDRQALLKDFGADGPQ